MTVHEAARPPRWCWSCPRREWVRGGTAPLLAALAGAGCTAAVTEPRGHDETVEGGSAPPPAGRRRDHGYADLVEPALEPAGPAATAGPGLGDVHVVAVT